MNTKEAEAAVLDSASREIQAFAEVTGSTEHLAHLERITVRTQPFRARVLANLTRNIEKTRIITERLDTSESEALGHLNTYFEKIDERDEWLETHLGLSTAFEGKQVRHCDYSETCDTCYGKGEGICPQCNGRKTVACQNWNCSNGEVKCDHFDCNNGYHRCVVCYGSGYVEKKVIVGHTATGPIENARSVQCNNCTGTGRGFRCVKCNGASKVNCRTCRGSSRVSCGTCRATGSLTCRTCNGAGHLSYRLTLTLHISTARSYLGPTKSDVERLCKRSPDFPNQLNIALRRNLQHASGGRTGQYSYDGEGSYAELVVDGKLVLFAGHPGRAAKTTSALYEPVLKEFLPLIDRLDVAALKTTRFGQAIVDVMVAGTKPKDSLLDRYDRKVFLTPRIQEVMKGAEAQINAGEGLLRLKIVLLASLVGALIYLVPFQNALASMGVEALIQSFSSVSAWFWGSFATLWASPFIAMQAFQYEQRIRRAERSSQIFGEPRKIMARRDFTTLFTAFVGQTAIMFCTFFLPEPLYPTPCQDRANDSKAACITLGLVLPYAGLPLTLDSNFERKTGASSGEPYLAAFGSYVADLRAF